MSDPVQKIFKYRISEKEGIVVGTHDHEKFPIDNMRLEWAYTLFFQKAYSRIIWELYERRTSDEASTPEEKAELKHYQKLCESMTISDDKEYVQIACTQEEIDFIEECARKEWRQTLNMHNDLKGKEFPEHLAHMKESLTNPDQQYLDYQNNRFRGFERILKTRKE
jgi:hypothetical protein